MQLHVYVFACSIFLSFDVYLLLVTSGKSEREVVGKEGGGGRGGGGGEGDEMKLNMKNCDRSLTENLFQPSAPRTLFCIVRV